jgi:hypothetical protein
MVPALGFYVWNSEPNQKEKAKTPAVEVLRIHPRYAIITITVQFSGSNVLSRSKTAASS